MTASMSLAPVRRAKMDLHFKMMGLVREFAPIFLRVVWIMMMNVIAHNARIFQTVDGLMMIVLVRLVWMLTFT